MVPTKVSAIAVVGNAVAVVPATLLPVAVVGVPALRAMLLPRAVLDSLLFLATLWTFVAPLLSLLLPIVPVLSLLLLGMLLLVLVLSLLLLGMLLLLVLLLLSVLWLGFGLPVLTLLLLRVVLFFALVLCISRGSDSEKQRQNGCAGDFSCVHMGYLCSLQDGLRLLAQASSCRVYRAADGFARYQKFHSPVLLPARGAIVGGYWQAVTEASGRN